MRFSLHTPTPSSRRFGIVRVDHGFRTVFRFPFGVRRRGYCSRSTAWYLDRSGRCTVCNHGIAFGDRKTPSFAPIPKGLVGQARVGCIGGVYFVFHFLIPFPNQKKGLDTTPPKIRQRNVESFVGPIRSKIPDQKQLGRKSLSSTG